jgi:hypothetical protein
MVPPRPEIGINIIIEGSEASKWVDIFSVPLAYASETTIEATRKTLTVPTTPRGTSIVNAHSPLNVFSGITPPAPLETDYPEPDDWVQPLGSEDTYDLGAVTKHNNKRWVSLVAFNVWEPGVANWREEVAEGYPEWIQPTGAQDAYALGAIVTHNGQNWISTTPANVWEPGVFGWDVYVP